MNLRMLLAGSIMLAASLGTNAQVRRCNTTEKFQELLLQDPSAAQVKEKTFRDAQNYSDANRSNKSGSRALLVVPVVVHIMHTGEAIGVGKNLSEAQILSQIDVLNEDYQFRNADTASIPAVFRPVAGNVGFEFRMATVDPDGNATNGIDRVNMGVGATWSDNWKDQTSWDNDNYLNLWVADIGGSLLGYATFPNSGPATEDGVALHYKYFGRDPLNPVNSNFDLGRTATHEIGHYFGLEHTFQGACGGNTAANCSNGGDGICDTPPTAGENYGCSSATQNTCTETPVNQRDMWMNYMDYSDDRCMYMFTQGQVDVMRGILNTSRATLLSSPASQSQNFFSYNGQVVDARTNAPVPNAKVLFYNGNSKLAYTTDASGTFTTPTFREGTYSVYAGKWGYGTTEYVQNTFIDSNSTALTIAIDPNHYYDDFTLDYDWTTSGNASTGAWEIGKPLATDYNGEDANAGADVTNDFTDFAFVTGNGGGQAGNDDVDGGTAVLTSPIFDLTGYVKPYLSYYRWFFNAGGQNGDPFNDTLTISLSNGTNTVVLEKVAGQTFNNWTFSNYKLGDLITATATMQLIVSIDDEDPGHIVEGGFDKFEVVDSLPPSGIGSSVAETRVSIYPNPNSGSFTVQLTQAQQGPVSVMVMNTAGQVVYSYEPGDVRLPLNISGRPAGVYLVRVQTPQGVSTSRVLLMGK
jgi:hypothetical protein